MSLLEEIAKVAPNLTQEDIDDLAGCSVADLAELLDMYIDAGKVPDRGAWQKIGEALQACAPYLSLGGAILGIVSGVWGLVK